MNQKPCLIQTQTNGFYYFPQKNIGNKVQIQRGLRKGLQWIVENYKPDGIQSIALPALGCGLGGLDWKDIGPMMCQYLSKLDVQVAIYLPQEQQIAPEFLTRKFLLSEK